MTKHRSGSRGQIRRFATVTILAGFLAASASAQTLQWDTNPGVAGAQGGSGDWDGGNFWLNGATNQAWVSESDAIFGGVAGTVDGSGISVNDITFNTAGYILAPSGADAGITFVGDLDFPGITAAADATINHALHSVVGFIKQGSGRVRIGAANHTLTGSITVNAGELEIGDGFDDVGLRLNVAAKLTTTDPNLTVGALTDNGATTGEVALGGNFSTGGANQNNTYGGDITGTGNFTKVGTGTMTLSGTNTFAGETFINAGRLEVRNGEAIPLQSRVTIAAGATLVVRDFEAIGSFAGSGSVELSSADLSVGVFGTSTFSGVITGQGGFFKLGGGTLTLAGVSTFSSVVPAGDDVTILQGGLAVADVANQGISSPLGAGNRLRFGDGGGELIFTASGTDSTDWNIAVGNVPATVEVTSTTGQLTLSGLIEGADVLAKTGAGALLLANSGNSFTGDFELLSGSVFVADVANSGSNSPLGAGNLISLGGGALGSGRLIFTGNGSDSSNRPMMLGVGSTIEVSAAAGSLTLSGSISGSGDLTKEGPGTLFPTNTANNFSGSVTVAEGTLISLALTNSSTASSLGAGTRITLGTPTTAGELVINGAANSTTNRQIDIASGGGRINSNAAAGTTVTFNGVITGTGPLTFAGNTNDVFVLTGPTNRTGATFIDRVKVQLSGGSGLPGTNSVELVDQSGASLQIDIPEVIGSLRGGAGASPGRVTLNSQLVVGGDNSSTTYAGLIEGSGGLSKRGTGILTLTNSGSSFVGGVTIAGGGAIAVPTGATTGVNSPLGANGTITFGDAISSGRLIHTGITSVSVTRPIALNAGGGIIENASTTGPFFLEGAITGPGGLIITGTREVAIRFAGKTYTGPTRVEQGTLILDGDISGSSLTIAPGGTFDTVTVGVIGPVSLSGGKLGVRLGGTGTLGTGDATFTSGELNLDFNGPGAGQFDALDVTGSVSFGGAIQLVLELFSDPADNIDILRIIQNDGGDVTALADASSGFVFGGNLLEEGERFTASTGAITQQFEIRYGLTAADNDVRLLAVPEPSSGALLILGIGFLMMRTLRQERVAAAQREAQTTTSVGKSLP